MIRSILIHPDPRLKKVCEPLPGVDDAARKLIDDMLDTMYDAPGIGLAAPQIGVTRRLLVMDVADAEAGEAPEPMALVNPEILEASEEMRTHNEGCLSVPDVYYDVTRPASVRVRYLDREGAERERAFDGLAATCVQHEIDHLNGRLFIDYLGSIKRQMVTQKMRKLKRERERAG
jgi:peptide deformylase